MSGARAILTIDPGLEPKEIADLIADQVRKCVDGVQLLGDPVLPMTVVVRDGPGIVEGEAGEDYLLMELAIDPMLSEVMGETRNIVLEVRRCLESARHHNLPLLPMQIELAEYVASQPE